MVKELVEEASGNWNVEAITERLGYAAAMFIITHVRPPRADGREDTLVFLPNSSGLFTVKRAYAELMNLTNQRLTQGDEGERVEDKDLWNHVWYEGEAPPRVRLFLWKLVHGALPLGQIMCSRLGRGDPTCVICGQSDETAMHLAFTCPFARSCWFAGASAMRTEGFTGSIRETLRTIITKVSKEQWSDVVASLWGIWRCRNECVFQGKVPNWESFLKFRNNIILENTIAVSAHNKGMQNSGTMPSLSQLPDRGPVCVVDGSWAYGWIGGAGYVLLLDGMLMAYRFERTVACCAIQAEACALLNAINFAIERGVEKCCFLSDCKTLVEACNSMQPPIDSDWRAHRETYEIWRKLKSNSNFECCHIGRCHTEVADTLAKKGRLLGESYTGFTHPIFPIDVA